MKKQKQNDYNVALFQMHADNTQPQFVELWLKEMNKWKSSMKN